MASRLNIAKEFSPVPIGRYKTDGDKSGEVFLEDFLYPKVSDAMKRKEKLEIDFTGMYGLSSSFLEEAFGGLVRKYNLSSVDILDTIVFLPEKSHFDLYIDLVQEYIRDAKPEVSDA